MSLCCRHGAKYFSKYLNTFQYFTNFKSTVRVRVQVSVAVMSMSTSTSIEYLSTFKYFQANVRKNAIMSINCQEDRLNKFYLRKLLHLINISLVNLVSVISRVLLVIRTMVFMTSALIYSINFANFKVYCSLHLNL